MKLMQRFFSLLCWLGLSLSAAQAQVPDYVLGGGDVIRVSVFQSPDLATEARVSESGGISFPLVGTIKVGGLSIPQTEQKIAQALQDGGFVLKAQVSVLLVQVRGSQVAVLGQVNRPGRFPLETTDMRLSDMLAIAGGISGAGSDMVIVAGRRDGKPFRREVDVATMYLKGDLSADILLQGGDAIYVHRAPVFYIYGEVQRPGAFRLERDMTVMQALANGGGISIRGTSRGLRINGGDADGRFRAIDAGLDDRLEPNHVIYVKESIF